MVLLLNASPKRIAKNQAAWVSLSFLFFWRMAEDQKKFKQAILLTYWVQFHFPCTLKAMPHVVGNL